MNSVMTSQSGFVDPVAEAMESGPDLKVLMDEYERAWTQGAATLQGIARIARAEDVRFTRWPGQSHTGLKHQELLPNGVDAKPYDKAPDCRIPFADETINWIVDVLTASFWGARVNPKPVHASKLTAMQAAELRAVISWMIHGPLAEGLINDVEFFGQVANTIGWCVLHPCWVKRYGWELQRLSLEQIVAIASRMPAGSVLAQAPLMVMDPELETEAADLLRAVVNGVAGGGAVENSAVESTPHPSPLPDRGGEGGGADGLADSLEGADGVGGGYGGGSSEGGWQMSLVEARRVIKELRESEDHRAEFPVAKIVENAPRLRVLVPWVDVVAPVEMTDPQRSRGWFTRDYYTEAEVEALVQDDGWSREFVDAVKQTAGQVSDGTQTEQTERDENARLIEIVIAYVNQVKDGVAGVYCTIFSANMAGSRGAGKGLKEGLCAKHFLLDSAHGKYPFVVYQTEVVGKRPSDARGVPEIVATQQLEVKRQRDALFVHTELSVTPPLKRIGTRATKIGPEFGPLAILNMSAGNEWEWFSPPPGKPELAFKLIEDIRRERDNYFGFPRIDSPPALAQARQQRMVNRWLMTWSQCLWQLSVLVYQNLTPEELAELLGRPPVLTAEELLKHKLHLNFDVRSLDNEWVKEMVGQIAEILALDPSSSIDRAKLSPILMGYLDPTLADEVTVDQAGAAQAVFNNVSQQVALIMLGNEAQYVENDPSAGMKLQFLQQIVKSNPDYVAVLMPQSPMYNERKALLMENYVKNLRQSMVQMDPSQNKLTGRLGVKPMQQQMG